MRNKVLDALFVLAAFSIIIPRTVIDHDKEPHQETNLINQKLLRGVQGGGFLEKSPPGRRRQKKAVAWIVGGFKGYTVARVENGILKKYDAELDMELYPGDRLYKKDDIKSVKFDFLSYAGIKIENKSGLIIKFNPPEEKENIFKEVGKFLGLVKTKFELIRGAW